MVRVSSTVSFAQCDSGALGQALRQAPDFEQKIARPGMFYASNGEFEGCASGSLSRRNITFIHGLGGNAGSWEKPATWTAQNYVVGTDKINYSGKGWETSFYSVAKEINRQMGSNLAHGIDQDFPNRCRLDDYVIAHSQGGIAARHLDRYWDIQQEGFGNRKFYGMVTFGTSHAGADIALNRDQHYGFVAKIIGTVVAGNVKELGYDITEKFHLFIGTKALKATSALDSFVEKQISPVVVSSLHTPTLDEMAPGSPEMERIHLHRSRLKKVAFYGVENPPECWRVVNNVVGRSATDYPLFQAVNDNELILKMDSIRAHHVAEIARNKVKIKKLRWLDKNPITGIFFNLGNNSKLRALLIINDHRQDAVDFLNHANTEWRYLIGSYHVDSFETVKVKKFVVIAELRRRGHVVDITTMEFDSRRAAEKFAVHIKQFADYQTSIELVAKQIKKRAFYPSDGVVLAKSQIAFPGIQEKNTDIMRGDNHFQERNSPSTKRVLEALYRGDVYDSYFKLDKRN